jgi:hypothetical protein
MDARKKVEGQKRVQKPIATSGPWVLCTDEAV